LLVERFVGYHQTLCMPGAAVSSIYPASDVIARRRRFAYHVRLDVAVLEVFESAGYAVLYALLYVVMLAGVVIIPFGIPGQFLIVAAGAGFALLAGTQVLSWWTVLVLAGLAAGAELLEAVAGFLGATSAKGSFWSSIGAVIGGLVGAIVGSMMAPVIGSLLGAFGGTFAGAFMVEYSRTSALAESSQVARGALIGRIVASILKVFIAIVMIVVITLALIY